MNDTPLRYAAYSVIASLLTMGLKFGAWFATNSVGILSDATESLINLAAGIMALSALIVARRPADTSHAYGHGKVEYFSSGAEGALILCAAGGIVYAAIGRFYSPVELNNLGLGLALALIASVINWTVARSMLKAARRFDSITLEADAKHLLTDVWTSAGLVAGLGVMLFAPSWRILDPIVAIGMAMNIVFTGVHLLRRSISGLMDYSLPEEEIGSIQEAIAQVAGASATYHGLRTRKSGSMRFLDFHLLVSGNMTVKRAHDLCCAVEDEIRRRLPGIQITCHMEPREDEMSWDGDSIGGLGDHRDPDGR